MLNKKKMGIWKTILVKSKQRMKKKQKLAGKID